MKSAGLVENQVILEKAKELGVEMSDAEFYDFAQAKRHHWGLTPGRRDERILPRERRDHGTVGRGHAQRTAESQNTE